MMASNKNISNDADSFLSGDVPGVAVLAADKFGSILISEAAGKASSARENAKPMTHDTVMWMASCTKLMTSVAAMQCVERGLIGLDDDVSKFLPEFESPDIVTGIDETGKPLLIKSTKKITLRHLLTHSSGIGYDFMYPQLAAWRVHSGGNPMDPQGDIAGRYLLPLLFEPGEGWSYGASVDWAGKLVERATSTTRLGEYMQKHIWTPLQMNSTWFQLNDKPELLARKANLATRNADGQWSDIDPYIPLPSVDDLGGGGVYSSVNDYSKLLVSLLKHDGQLLKPENSKKLFEPQLSGPALKALSGWMAHPEISPMFRGGVESLDWNYGLGGVVNTENVEGIAHKGTLSWSGMPNCFWFIDPSAGNCGVYGSQVMPPGDKVSIDMNVTFRKAAFRS